MSSSSPAVPLVVSGDMAIPQRWRAMARPFLQRADEFASREPVVAYFLRRHVLFACMRDRPKNDAECNTFLSTLMSALEAAALALGAQAKEEYGKAVLPLLGLKLFALADTAEREGQVASVRTVRQFFAAALVLEATAQFSEDGVTLDPDVAEKCKYAKYIAVRMKRALDSGVRYESPNAQQQAQQQPSSSLSPRTTSTTAASAPPPDDADEGDYGGGRSGGKAYAHDALPTPPRAPAAAAAPSYEPPAIVTPPPPPPPAATSHTTHAKPAAPVVSPYVARSHNNNSGGGGAAGGPSIEVMIDAQKYARQAVSALQFYDAANAVRQLREALRLLEEGGGGGKATA